MNSKKLTASRALDWRTYVDRLTQEEKNRLLSVLLEHELEDVDGAFRFRAFDDDPEYGVEACIYWEGSGDSLLEDFEATNEADARPAMDSMGIDFHGEGAAQAARDDLAKRLEAAEQFAASVFSGMQWTGDGYEWTGGTIDYRVHPQAAARMSIENVERLEACP